MAKTIRQSATISWTTVTAKIRAQAREAYSRDLSLHQRIHYVNCFLLPKAWYTAQILPPTSDCIRQLNTATSWYIWRGEIFRVTLSTLYKSKDQEGWALINVAAKCRALLIYRLQAQGQYSGSLTAKWLGKWNLLHPSKNPPHIKRIPEQLEYLRLLEMDTAYITSQRPEKPVTKYRRRVYDVFLQLA
jgi:hypothetical protein